MARQEDRTQQPSGTECGHAFLVFADTLVRIDDKTGGKQLLRQLEGLSLMAKIADEQCLHELKELGHGEWADRGGSATYLERAVNEAIKEVPEKFGRVRAGTADAMLTRQLSDRWGILDRLNKRALEFVMSRYPVFGWQGVDKLGEQTSGGDLTSARTRI